MASAAKDWVDKGVTVGLSHGVFALWVQAVSMVVHAPVPPDGSVALSLLLLPLAQPSTWGMVVILAVAGASTLWGAVGRAVYFTAFVLLNLALIIDQQVFGRFYEHFSPALLDAGIGNEAFLLVVVGAVDAAALVSFVGLAAVSYYVFRVVWRDDVPRVLDFTAHVVAGLRRPLFYVTVAAFAAMNVWGALRLPLHQVNEHPLVMPIYRAVAQRDMPWNRPHPVNVRSLRYGTLPDDADPLSEYLRDPPLALVDGAPRRMIWIETGTVNIPSDLFSELASQHAGLNRLLAGGVVFEKFLYGRTPQMIVSRLRNALPGYRIVEFDVGDAAPAGGHCVDRQTALAAIDAWWSEHVAPEKNVLAFLDIANLEQCNGLPEMATLAPVVGALEGRNRQTGDADQTVIMVSGHYADAEAERPLALAQLQGFLLMHFPDRLGTPLTTPRQAGEDDLVRTLAAMAGRTTPAGRDMLAPRWPQQLLYFVHGDPTLRAWSVIDGEWQYTANAWGTEQALLHIQQDSLQERDFSAHFPNRLRYYDRLLGVWYAREGFLRAPPGGEFVQHQGQWWRPAFLNTPGPKIVRIGYMGGIDPSGDFEWGNWFNPREPIVAFIRTLPSTRAVDLSFEWFSPSKERGRFQLTGDPGWTYSYMIPGFGLPMAEGRWSVLVKDTDNGRVLVAEEFRVDRAVPLRAQVTSTAPEVRSLTVGYFTGDGTAPEREFLASSVLGGEHRPVMAMEWTPPQHMSYLTYRWRSPSGVYYSGDHGVRPQWPKTWIVMDPGIERVAGQWAAQLLEDERVIAEQVFEVTNQPN